MKVANQNEFPKEISRLGTSDLFSYATDKKYDAKDLKNNDLQVWAKLLRYDTANSYMRVPLNGFEEAIMLTEQGRLWKYPIDNECGMEQEQQVPFEEHVFLDKYLEEFPKNENIQAFMGFVIAGLAKNPWMTVDRKRKAIEFYKEYFEAKRDIYKRAGLDI